MRALKFIAQMAIFIGGYLLLNLIIGFSDSILHTYQDFFAWVTCIVMIGGPIALIVWITRSVK
jgi:hypothetical protein